MTHSDSLVLPEDIKSKQEFYEHLLIELKFLCEINSMITAQNYFSILSNAASLLFGSINNYHTAVGDGKIINWTGSSIPKSHYFNRMMTRELTQRRYRAIGFYLIPSLFPPFKLTPTPSSPSSLLIAPFSGKPACQFVSLQSKQLGVCATSFVKQITVIVNNVEDHPGHIACDGSTKSEIVIPLKGRSKSSEGIEVIVGVLDLDCKQLEGFDEEDKKGLEIFVEALMDLIDWGI